MLRKVQFLTEKIKEKRQFGCKGLLSRFAVHGLNKVAFTDEKLFTIEQAYNRQNDRILSAPSSSIPDQLRYVKRTQKPLSVMGWAGISSKGRTQLVSVPEGAENQLHYL